MKRELEYLALGDSLTAGIGAPPERSFVQQYIQLTEHHQGLALKTEQAGKSGATAEQILQTIRTDAQVKAAAGRSSIITLTAGGNDLIRAAKTFYFDNDKRHLMIALKQFQRNISAILKTIHSVKQGGGNYTIFTVGLYNPLPEFEEAVFWVNKFNEHTRSLQSEVVRFVDVYDAFLGNEDAYLSDDRFHPNEHGYRVIAECVHAAGYPSTASGQEDV
ncbi:MAG: spore germination lipase LipC [Paenibacillus sp.]|jgi:lysophospholipase L1-like esterase|nr:spore germination lipase LipC [Paenibacillus sp.]